MTGLPAPVRRYLDHALRNPATASPRVRLTMTGRVKVGPWLRFRATWEGDGRSFRWQARAGLLHVVDGLSAGAGSMDVRLLGRVPLVHAADEDTTRSAAGRAAAEAIWTPGGLRPEHGVRWRADADDLIAATWDVGPERPELRLRIDASGAVRTACVLRWHSREHAYVPCGATVAAERTFGDLTIPSRLAVAWGFGTPRPAPFFEATITGAQPLPV